ncbi:MAG: hypothetical protein ACREP5_17230 [Candidatus Binatia bacterium]
MATKKAAKKSRTINQRFTALERLVRFEFRGLHKQMDERFTVMEDRIDRIASHVDGFMKLHETLDIEVRVMKEQMNRFEERLKRIELAQTS